MLISQKEDQIGKTLDQQKKIPYSKSLRIQLIPRSYWTQIVNLDCFYFIMKQKNIQGSYNLPFRSFVGADTQTQLALNRVEMCLIRGMYSTTLLKWCKPRQIVVNQQWLMHELLTFHSHLFVKPNAEISFILFQKFPTNKQPPCPRCRDISPTFTTPSPTNMSVSHNLSRTWSTVL